MIYKSSLLWFLIHQTTPTMIYQEFLPPPPLRKYIHLYCLLGNDNSYKKNIIEKIPPTLARGLIFFFQKEDTFMLESTKIRYKNVPMGYVLALCSDSYTWHYQFPFKLINILFKPGQFRKFFNLPMNEIMDVAYSFQELGLKELELLHEKMYATTTMKEKIDIVNTYLLKKLKRIETNNDLTDFCLGNLLSFKTRKVEQLSSLTGKSERHIRRVFKNKMGIAPKNYMKNIRLNFVLSMIQNPNLKLTDLAYLANYADQAHFIREFKEATGLTPKQYRKTFHPIMDVIHWREEVKEE